MRENIRFAWGISSLGDFVVAMSDKGIVALEFNSMRTAMEDALRARFPDAELEYRQEEMAGVLEIVAGVIDDPRSDCDVSLDLRGTPYEVRVWQMLREIPAGQTTSYGVLAAKLGSRDAREVTAAIANNSIAVIVPCHRVIKKTVRFRAIGGRFAASVCFSRASSRSWCTDMSRTPLLQNDAQGVLGADIQLAVGRHENLPEPLDVIRLSLASTEAAREDFPGYRLTRLVAARLELDEADIRGLSDVLGVDLLRPILGVPRPFDFHLRDVIARYDLDALFHDDGHAPYHHSIRPTGYDFYRDEVIPVGMEQWRADYRHMSDERQMMAASIVWLYRAGKDNVWLRRVPCTWHAADAIACLNAAGAFEDWARLYALYPGW